MFDPTGDAPTLPGRSQNWWETCQEILNRSAQAVFFAYEPEKKRLYLRAYSPKGELREVSIPLKDLPALAADRLDPDTLSQCLQALQRAAITPGGGSMRFSVRADGASSGEEPASGSEPLCYRARWASLADSLGRIYIVLGRAEEAEAERRDAEALRLRAERDAITGLYNRQTMEERVEKSLQAGRADAFFILLDIDNFKRVNDRHGHLAGDALLRKLGRLLLDRAGEGGLAGRVGGDEFALLLFEKAPERILARIRELQALVNALPGPASGDAELFALSAGIYRPLPSDRHFENVFERADYALYQAKAEGKNRIRFYAQGEFPRADDRI